MRALAGILALALGAAGCRSVPAPVAGGYRGVEQITILATGME